MSIMEKDEVIHDVIIVGSGPAGYTAAVYCARADLQPIVCEGLEYGGILMKTTEVENYPGFRNGIMGPELMEEMRAQAERFGATLLSEDVDSIDVEGNIKEVHSADTVYRARTVIIATGAEPRYLGVPGEEEFMGRGVSACATCDGFFFKDKPIAVVGGGDSAMEEADFLSRFGSSVTIIHRRDEFRASQIMVDRAKQNEKINFEFNAVVSEVRGEMGVTELVLKDTVTGDERTLEANAMFVAIGHEPRSQMVRESLECDDKGYIKVSEPSTRTSVPGVFAAGDVVDNHYQQAITAAGSGCRAALDAEHYLAALADN